MSIAPDAGTAIAAGVCIAHPRDVRRATRETARILRKQAARRRRSPITCQVYYGHDRAREALAVYYTDPTPGDLADLDQLHAFLTQFATVQCALVVAHCEVSHA